MIKEYFHGEQSQVVSSLERLMIFIPLFSVSTPSWMGTLGLLLPYRSVQSSICKSDTTFEASNFDLKEGIFCGFGSGGSGGMRFGVLPVEELFIGMVAFDYS